MSWFRTKSWTFELGDSEMILPEKTSDPRYSPSPLDCSDVLQRWSNYLAEVPKYKWMCVTHTFIFDIKLSWKVSKKNDKQTYWVHCVSCRFWEKEFENVFTVPSFCLTLVSPPSLLHSCFPTGWEGTVENLHHAWHFFHGLSCVSNLKARNLMQHDHFDLQPYRN